MFFSKYRLLYDHPNIFNPDDIYEDSLENVSLK